MTVFQMLKLLASHGWRQKLRVGRFRLLEHPDRPGVYLTLVGHLSRRLSRREVLQTLANAGIEE